MSVRDAAGCALPRRPVGVGGADDPVPAPRDDEQHATSRCAGSARSTDWIRSRGTTRWMPLDARTWNCPRSPTIAWVMSVQTPVALTTCRARTSISVSDSKSRTRTPVTRSPSRRKPTTRARLAHSAPYDCGGAHQRHRVAGVVDLRVVVLDRARPARPGAATGWRAARRCGSGAGAAAGRAALPDETPIAS